MTTILTDILASTLENSDQTSVADMFIPVLTETLNSSSVVADVIAPNPNLPDWAAFTSNLLPASSYTGGVTIFPYQFSLASPEDLAFISFDWKSVRNGKAIIAVSGATISHSASPFIDVSSSWLVASNLNPLIAPYGYRHLPVVIGDMTLGSITGTISEIIFGKYEPPAAGNLISGYSGPTPIVGGFFPLDGVLSTLAANLITNPDFNTDATGWTLASGAALSGSGILLASANSNLASNDVVDSAKWYCFTFDIVDPTPGLFLDAYCGNTPIGPFLYSGGGGTKKVFVKSTAAAAAALFLNDPGSTGTCIIDNVSVQEVLGSLNYSNTSVGVRTIDISTVAMSFVNAMSHAMPEISSSVTNPSLAVLDGINPSYMPGSINIQTQTYNFNNVLRQLLVTPTSTTPFTITIDIVNDRNVTLSSNAYTSSIITDRTIPDPYTAPVITTGNFVTAPNAQTTGVMFQGAARALGSNITDLATATTSNSVTVIRSDLTAIYLGTSSFSATGCCGAGLPAYNYGLFIGGRNLTSFSQSMWTVSATPGDVQTFATILPMSVVSAAAAGCEDMMICYGGGYGSLDGTGLSPSSVSVTERPGTAFAQYSQLDNETDVTGAVFKCDNSTIYNIVDYTSSGKRKNSAGVGNFSNALPTGTTTNPLCHFVGGNNGKSLMAIDNYTVMNKDLDALVINKAMTRPQSEIIGCALSSRAAYMSSDKIDRGSGFINREWMLSIVDITGTRLVATSFLNMFGGVCPDSVGSAFGFGPRGVFISQASTVYSPYKTTGYVIDTNGNWTDITTYLQPIIYTGGQNRHGKSAAYASF